MRYQHMGKQGSHKKGYNATTWPQSSITIREESTGKKLTNADAKSVLKLQHVKNLAVWASCEASVPSLGAFFGHRLAAYTEALGTPADPSLFACQRCESILQPGSNCTIRIEKNRTKLKRRSKKCKPPLQNNVVYNCHLCSHRNLVRGTPRGYMKELYQPKVKAPSNPEPANVAFPEPATPWGGTIVNIDVNKTSAVASGKGTAETVEASKNTELVLAEKLKDDSVTNNPITPMVRQCSTLLDSKRRKRNKSGSKKATESESSSTVVGAEKAASPSNKRRRKSWTSLKEIAEGSDNAKHRNLTNFSIPFVI